MVKTKVIVSDLSIVLVRSLSHTADLIFRLLGLKNKTADPKHYVNKTGTLHSLCKFRSLSQLSASTFFFPNLKTSRVY